MAATTCAAVLAGNVVVVLPSGLVTVTAAPVPAWTVIALPLTLTLRGAFAEAGAARIWAVMLLPPSWPQASELRTTARACSAAAGAVVEPVYGVVMPMTVWDLR